jgi:hypothetical protein
VDLANDLSETHEQGRLLQVVVCQRPGIQKPAHQYARFEMCDFRGDPRFEGRCLTETLIPAIDTQELTVITQPRHELLLTIADKVVSIRESTGERCARHRTGPAVQSGHSICHQFRFPGRTSDLTCWPDSFNGKPKASASRAGR